MGKNRRNIKKKNQKMASRGQYNGLSKEYRIKKSRANNYLKQIKKVDQSKRMGIFRHRGSSLKIMDRTRLELH